MLRGSQGFTSKQEFQVLAKGLRHPSPNLTGLAFGAGGRSSQQKPRVMRSPGRRQRLRHSFSPPRRAQSSRSQEQPRPLKGVIKASHRRRRQESVAARSSPSRYHSLDPPHSLRQELQVARDGSPRIPRCSRKSRSSRKFVKAATSFQPTPVPQK